MTTIRMETLPESERRLIRSAADSTDGIVFEEDGLPAFRLTAYATPTAAPTPEWTVADNARRCHLIDKDLDGLLTPDELRELEALEERLEGYVDVVAPLPLGPLRKLYHEALDTAARSNGTPTA
jgi:hypothetical protein